MCFREDGEDGLPFRSKRTRTIFTHVHHVQYGQETFLPTLISKIDVDV